MTQIALVTGAGSGIGRASAEALAVAGFKVILTGRRESALQETRSLSSHGTQMTTISCDVTQPESVDSLFAQIESTHGRLDVLFNNAGTNVPAMTIDELSVEQWQQVINVNLTGQFLCAREAVTEFKRRGVVKEVSCAAGKIIHMSSVHEIIPWAGHVNYAASKGGVMLMMKSIAQEVAPYRIRVNSIAPGAIRTPINTTAWQTPEAYDALMKLVPYKRIGETDDIARAAVWLASDQADYVNGISLIVDGGMTLYPGFATGG